MTDPCCGVGAMSKLAIGLASGTQTRMDFIHFTPNITKTLSDGSGNTIRGTLDHSGNSVAQGMLHVKFRTSFYMTAAKMDVLLPCLGFTESTDVWTLGNVLPLSTVVVGPSGAPEDTYSGCVPTDFVIMGRKGQDPVVIDIGWIGKTWASAAAGTFFTSQSSPAMTEGYAYPFAATGSGNASSLNILGQSLAFPQFRLSMDYKILEEFNNSVTATNLCPSDHVLKFATSALYSTCDGNTDLWTEPMGGDITGASLTMNFQRLVGAANHQTQVVVANAKLIARAPEIKKNDYNRLPVNAVGYATDAAALLVITNHVGT